MKNPTTITEWAEYCEGTQREKALFTLYQHGDFTLCELMDTIENLKKEVEELKNDR